MTYSSIPFPTLSSYLFLVGRQGTYCIGNWKGRVWFIIQDTVELTASLLLLWLGWPTTTISHLFHPIEPIKDGTQELAVAEFLPNSKPQMFQRRLANLDDLNMVSASAALWDIWRSTVCGHLCACCSVTDSKFSIDSSMLREIHSETGYRYFHRGTFLLDIDFHRCWYQGTHIKDACSRVSWLTAP